MRFCDYCGDELATDAGESVAIGHSDAYLRACSADEWFYYCEGECIKAVHSMLGNMAKWANQGEGAGLQWQLVEAPGAARAQTPGAAPRISNKGTVNLDGAELTGHAAGALRCAGIRTLEDVAKRSEFELLQLKGIGPKMFAGLVGAMEARGLSLRSGPSAEEVGARIRQLRESIGLSRDDVANAIDPRDARGWHGSIYGDTVGAWERAALLPSVDNLKALGELFRVPVAELTGVTA